MIEAVTVISDLLRPDGNCRPGGRDRSTLWLWNVLKRPLQLAAGLPVEALTVAGLPGLRAWIEQQRPPGHADAHWATLYERLPPGLAAERMIAPPLHRRFCVGFEMPPWLRHLLDDLGTPYLDLHVHPVRFMDDLMFAARASRAGTQAALLAVAVMESEVAVTAGLVEAMGRFISEARMPDDTLLVAGQRRYDSTQIIGGGFFDAGPLADDIQRLCARHAAVILKPHPFDRRHSLLDVAAVGPARVFGVTDDNIYRLMALPQITAVLTVNSSVAHEAPWFGKQVHTLAPLPLCPAWRGAAAAGGAHASLDDIVLTPDLWRTVLAPHTPVTAADGMRLRAKPNRLRIAFDSFWNYQQIDTDRVPRAASAG